jgi:hypothetical protein
MPTYTFRNKETQETQEIFMRISDLEKYKQDHPELEKIVDAPLNSLIDPVRIGALQPPQGFKEVLRNIHKRTANSNLDKGSNWV